MKRPTAEAAGRGHHRPRRTDRADRRSGPRAADRAWCSTARRSTARSGGQVGDTGEIAGQRLSFRGGRHAEGRRLHAAPGPSPRRARSQQGADGHRPGRRRRAGQASAAPTPPRTCCTTPCKSTSASTPSSRARRSTRDWLRFDFTNPTAVAPRGTAAHRRRSRTSWSPPRPRSSGARLPLAEARESRGHDALRREVSRRGAAWCRSATSARSSAAAPHLDNTGQIGLFKIIGEESVCGRHAPDHRP